ncbi:MAG: CaiB/BaiF CoA transferase family protein [Oscillospiraceae bacterium]
MATMKRPLEGVKVVELATHAAGPTTTRMLADWGADVVKVEGTSGDEWRMLGTIYGIPVEDDENPLFNLTNMGKKLVSLNLKDPEGKAALLKLLETADVFVSSVRLKSLQKMGLDYETLKKQFPGLVYTHVTGYGYEGPDSERPGFDRSAFWAKCGALVDWPAKDSPPLLPLSAFGDVCTTTMLVSGTLAALLAKRETGEGSLVSASLYGSALWYHGIGILITQAPYSNVYPKDPKRPLRPLSHFYQCKDGEWINTTTVDHDKVYAPIMKALGLDEYLDDPRFFPAKAMDEGGHSAELCTLIRERMFTKTAEEWGRILQDADIVNERMLHTGEVPNDPQAWANDYLMKAPMPSGTVLAMPANPVQFSEYEKTSFSPSGPVGQHTDEVLADAGYSPDQLARLRADGAIR